jgi:hypothetical protein
MLESWYILVGTGRDLSLRKLPDYVEGPGRDPAVKITKDLTKDTKAGIPIINKYQYDLTRTNLIRHQSPPA